ncbi:group-specific protein [Virgibacillus ndiopensis]|uniref:group-specific protein n=1 Tax=Virgibacillus ndiopensis TaxID=2004408 RepID=UPI000C06E4BB|nr:group-specific protein [Virgibacillus ndiopensis]
MKFYIASSFANKQAVHYISQKLMLKGYTQTYDWTKNQRATTNAQLHAIGTLEKQAVADCDVFLLLLPAGKGSHVELGIALGLGKRVHIYSSEQIDPANASTFYYLDGVERFFGEVDDFIKKIGLT